MENFIKIFLKKIKTSEPIISTILGAIVILVIGGLILNYFQKPEQENNIKVNNVAQEEKQKQHNQKENLSKQYKVKKGDNLWDIAKEYYGSGYNWINIDDANDLKNPGLIVPEQILTIPHAEMIDLTSKDYSGENISEFEKPIEETEYIVKEGDNLWNISLRKYGDGYQWQKIAQLNNLDNPNILLVGKVLQLPEDI
jgi:nucleoid-associated protein YgaU